MIQAETSLLSALVPQRLAAIPHSMYTFGYTLSYETLHANHAYLQERQFASVRIPKELQFERMDILLEIEATAMPSSSVRNGMS